MPEQNRYTANKKLARCIHGWVAGPGCEACALINKILDLWAQNLTAPAISEISGVPRKRVLRIVQTARTDNDLLKFTRHGPGIKPKDASNV